LGDIRKNKALYGTAELVQSLVQLGVCQGALMNVVDTTIVLKN
jgi:hypothetical protein